MIEFTLKTNEELVPQLNKLRETLIEAVEASDRELIHGMYGFVANQILVLRIALEEEHVTEHEAHQMCKTIAATLSLMSR